MVGDRFRKLGVIYEVKCFRGKKMIISSRMGRARQYLEIGALSQEKVELLFNTQAHPATLTGIK